MDDLAVALQAANTGAGVLASRFGERLHVRQKGRLDPVTEVDLASEKAIVAVLREHRPGDGILAEEGSGQASAGRRWIIDPLDGTVNFIHGIPHFSVSVALWDDDTGLVGVVIHPVSNETFAAARGQGATLNGRTISVSSVTAMHQAVVVTGFPYDHDRFAPEYAAPFTAVLAEVNGIRRLGSAALDFAWVAAGRFDAYFEMTIGPWDGAAGIVILSEAGGRTTDQHGTPSTPDMPLIIASNGHLHERLVEIIEPLVPPHLSNPSR
ncbi:inositol-1-monophosphatase [bacterium BMS3Bbin02]|nr:inositol-1-monophosphatase [bacterium BMS3Bbin02]